MKQFYTNLLRQVPAFADRQGFGQGLGDPVSPIGRVLPAEAFKSEISQYPILLVSVVLLSITIYGDIAYSQMGMELTFFDHACALVAHQYNKQNKREKLVS